MAKDPKDRSTVVRDRPDPAGPEVGFLGRWSRRKTLARTRQEHEKKERAALEEPTTNLPSQEAAPPVKKKTDADMAPLETLDENSDYSGFLSPKVSDQLRRVALRKLFHLPKFNITDGLDDYDEDYRTFEALGDIMTADKRHQIELEEEKARERLSEEHGAEPAEAEPVEPTEPVEPIDVAASGEPEESGSSTPDDSSRDESGEDGPPAKT